MKSREELAREKAMQLIAKNVKWIEDGPLAPKWEVYQMSLVKEITAALLSFPPPAGEWPSIDEMEDRADKFSQEFYMPKGLRHELEYRTGLEIGFVEGVEWLRERFSRPEIPEPQTKLEGK